MKIAIIGAGAVGGYFGGCLARAGHEVTFIARGKTLDALHRHGLIVRSELGDFSIKKPHAVETFIEADRVDLVLPAVKAYQLRDLTPRLGPLLGPRTLVVPLQNGVEAPYMVREDLGPERTLGGFCRVFASQVEPGVIVHHSFEPTILFGEIGGPNTERVEELRAGLADAEGMKVLTPENIEVAIWQKAMGVTPLGAVGAASRSPIGAVRANPTTRWTLESAVAELAAVAESRGVPLPADSVTRVMEGFDKLTPETTASMHRDLIEGRPSELDEQLGVIVRYGAERHVPTPVCRTLYGVLKAIAGQSAMAAGGANPR